MPIDKTKSRWNNRAGGTRWARNQIASYERRLARARGNEHRQAIKARYVRACIIAMTDLLEKG